MQVLNRWTNEPWDECITKTEQSLWFSAGIILTSKDQLRCYFDELQT